jgi:predicted enzyme related to lactoylglutathione lyase
MAGWCRGEEARVSGPRSTAFSFTKLVVDDLEKMADFYTEVFGLAAVHRVRAEIGGEPIEEILFGAGGELAPGSLVLLKFVGRPRPRPGEVLLGFTTDDLPALLDRVVAAGGAVHEGIREMPEMKLRVAFATDPEGHLAELVQMLA